MPTAAEQAYLETLLGGAKSRAASLSNIANIRAQGDQQRAQTNAQFVGGLSNIATQTIQGITKQREQQKQDSIRADAAREKARHDVAADDLAQRKQREAELKAQLEQSQAGLKFWVDNAPRVLEAAKDPAQFAMWKRAIGSFSPEIAEMMTPENAPALVDRVAEQHKSVQRQLDGLNLINAGDTHVKNLEAQRASYTEGLATFLSTAKSDEEYQGMLQKAARRALPNPESEQVYNEALSMFPPTFDAAKIQQMALTPKDRAAQVDKSEDNIRADKALKIQQQNADTSRISATKPPEGALVQIAGPDGKAIWVTRENAIGKPAAQAARGVTGAERQVLAFYNRAKEGHDTVSKVEDRFIGLPNQVGLKWSPNIIKSDEQQSYRQGQREFTEARLRKESGAAIPDSEFENDRQTYFAQPGDSAATIAQKKKGRETMLEGLAFASGKAYDEFYGEPRGAKSGVEVTGKDGKSYRFPTQAQADAFKKAGG